MNKTDRILDTLTTQLQRQHPRIVNEEDLTNRIMSSLENTDRIPHRWSVPFPGWFAPIRAAATVASLLFIGLFALLEIQPAEVTSPSPSATNHMEQYEIHLSNIPPDSSPREIYSCYRQQKMEQTFYHNEFKKMTHENL